MLNHLDAGRRLSFQEIPNTVSGNVTAMRAMLSSQSAMKHVFMVQSLEMTILS